MLKEKKEYVVYLSAKLEYSPEMSKMFGPHYVFIPPFSIFFTENLTYTNFAPTFSEEFKTEYELLHGKKG